MSLGLSYSKINALLLYSAVSFGSNSGADVGGNSNHKGACDGSSVLIGSYMYQTW